MISRSNKTSEMVRQSRGKVRLIAGVHGEVSNSRGTPPLNVTAVPEKSGADDHLAKHSLRVVNSTDQADTIEAQRPECSFEFI